ncbi:MAG: hypothetical protein ACRD3L_17575 [Terriglobales bacterium]
MQVNLKPETESRLHELANQSGRPTDELVEDAMAAYLREVTDIRGMLDDRYDGVKSGRVQAVDGEDTLARLRRKSEARRSQRS